MRRLSCWCYALPGIRADLDRLLFQRALSNLVGNAIRYTPRGGRIAVTAAREEGELRVDVTDTGVGIAAEHLPHIFDRFFRRPGTLDRFRKCWTGTRHRKEHRGISRRGSYRPQPTQ